MTPEQALAELKKGKAAPCYLLYGEQEYLIQETLNDLLDLIIPVADRAFGLFSLDGDAAEFDLLKDHLLSASLLGGKKVVVVKETTIFQPRETPGELIVKIRENLDEHPDKAAATRAKDIKRMAIFILGTPMAAVTERLSRGFTATAEMRRLAFFGLIDQRLHAAALVGPVAKRFSPGLAAGAPEIFFPRLHLHRMGAVAARR